MKAVNLLLAAATVALSAVLAVGLLLWGYSNDTRRER